MRRRRLLFVLGGLALIALLGVLSTRRMLRGPHAIAEMTQQRLQLRMAADSCRDVLAEGEARLHGFRSRLDSMHDRVRDFEALDPRGVPADSYSIYMAAFEQYNDSAAGWDARVDTLQAHLGRCREVIERHNVAADSLRGLLQERARRGR